MGSFRSFLVANCVVNLLANFLLYLCQVFLPIPLLSEYLAIERKAYRDLAQSKMWVSDLNCSISLLQTQRCRASNLGPGTATRSDLDSQNLLASVLLASLSIVIQILRQIRENLQAASIVLLPTPLLPLSWKRCYLCCSLYRSQMIHHSMKLRITSAFRLSLRRFRLSSCLQVDYLGKLPSTTLIPHNVFLSKFWLASRLLLECLL